MLALDDTGVDTFQDTGRDVGSVLALGGFDDTGVDTLLKEG